MSNTAVPVPSELPYPLIPAHLQALSRLLKTYDAETTVEMLQQLFRGWMASPCVHEVPEQRGDFFDNYELLLNAFQQMASFHTVST